MSSTEPANLSNDELRKALGLEDDPDYLGNFSSSEVSATLEEMTDNTLQSSWEDFDGLMLQMPQYLRRLQVLLNDGRHPKINLEKDADELYVDPTSFHSDAISLVEDFFLDILDETKSFSGEIDDLKLYVGLYLGEAIAENLGGEWMICENDKLDDYGKPVVALWEGEDYESPLNPFEIVEILSQTKRRGILNGAINGMQQGTRKQ